MKKESLKLIIIIILILIIFILLYGGYLLYKEYSLPTNTENTNNIYYTTLVSTPTSENVSNTSTKNEVNNLNMIDEEYLGFTVDSKLEIPSINLVTNVLSNYTKESLDTSPSKFYGPSPNAYGNYCVAGHNYIYPNMFKNLINLNIGDKIYLTDNVNGRYEYEVYDMYKVDYTNTDSLIQNTDDTRLLTLITCINYTDFRLIIKAIEV